MLWAYGNGITNGTAEEAFSPEDPVARGRMITFLRRAMGRPGATGAGAWYTGAENRGRENGYLSASYAVNSPCPRCDAVWSLWRTAG